MSDYNYNQYLADLQGYPFSVGMLDFEDEGYKDARANILIRYMLNRTQKMFIYEGLPDTIPVRMLETILQTCGNVCITEVDGKLYAFFGGLGGMLDEYYQPTIYTIANPYLKFDAMLKIKNQEECIWGRSDSYGMGLIPLFQWYASMIVEGELSLRVALINSRIAKTISAPDDSTLKSANKYLEDIENGKLGTINDSAFFEGLNIHATPTANEHITDIVEALQYLKATWFNDLGLNANYNMKRERIQNAEVKNDNDALLPLVDDMLSARAEMVELINEKYGLNIKVKLASAWEDVQEDTNNETENEDKNITDTNEVVSNSLDDNVENESEPLENTPVSENEETTPEDTENEPTTEVNVVVNVGNENETTLENDINESEVSDENAEKDEDTEIEGGVDSSK